MNMPARNSGVVNQGSGTINFNGVAIGDGASVTLVPHSRTAGAIGPERCSIALLTVLPVETFAVRRSLQILPGYRKFIGPQGAPYCEAEVIADGEHHRIVATQTADQGQRSATIAFGNLVKYYSPALVVLVGIAGGIHRDVVVGDVVVAHDVVYYDARKETPTGTVRRGQELSAPVVVRHAANDFFADHGKPCGLTDDGATGGGGRFHVWPGLIGSGEAVVGDAESGIRSYLAKYNDKLLAVETEAAGVAQALYEMAGMPEAPLGWLTVRGISDVADQAKDDSRQELASRRAAAVVELLLPYLLSRVQI